MIDAAAALEHATAEPVLKQHEARRCNRNVLLTPPWPEIFVNDDDGRRHNWDVAVGEHDIRRLLKVYSALRYSIDVLPKASVRLRADLIVRTLGRHPWLDSALA